MKQELIERIKLHEGFIAKAYLDSLGNYTIGYGTLIDNEYKSNISLKALFQHGISKAQGEYMLIAYIADLSKNYEGFPWYDRQCQDIKNVMLEMGYQLGEFFYLHFKHTIEAFENFDFLEASNQMLESKWHRQTPNRCEELADIVAKHQSRTSKHKTSNIPDTHKYTVG